jgi:hypothetical protein
MSSNSYMWNCPVCNKETLLINNDSSPFERIDTSCNNCWFYSYTKTWRITLSEFLYEKADEIVNNQNKDYTEEQKNIDIKKYNSFSEDDFNI